MFSALTIVWPHFEPLARLDVMSLEVSQSVMAEIIAPYDFDPWPLFLVRGLGVVPEELSDTNLASKVRGAEGWATLADSQGNRNRVQSGRGVGGGRDLRSATHVWPTQGAVFPPNPMKGLWTSAIKANH